MLRKALASLLCLILLVRRFLLRPTLLLITYFLADGDQEELAATFASLETIGEYNSAFMQLESGAVDAIAMDMPVAQAHVAEKSGYVILDEHLSTESYAVGFKKGNTEQAKQIERHFEGNVRGWHRCKDC